MKKLIITHGLYITELYNINITEVLLQTYVFATSRNGTLRSRNGQSVVSPRYWFYTREDHGVSRTVPEITWTFASKIRRVWSALGIHRVPYEFWKVGTWKPAVNARSIDSQSFFFMYFVFLGQSFPFGYCPSGTSLKAATSAGDYAAVILESALCHY